ncbi:MAG: hypothetical protein Kow0031_14390 [Anaerolineae bacterium]
MTTQFEWKFTDGQFTAITATGEEGQPVSLPAPNPAQPYYLYLGQPDSVVQVEIFNTHPQFEVDNPPAGTEFVAEMFIASSGIHTIYLGSFPDLLRFLHLLSPLVTAAAAGAIHSTLPERMSHAH